MEPDNTNVLVLQLGGETEGEALRNRHHQFLTNLKRRFGMTLETDPSRAITHLKELKPRFVLAVDSGFANPAYRRVQDQIANHNLDLFGSCLILCCEFPRNFSVDDWKPVLFSRFSSTWEFAGYRAGECELGNPKGLLAGFQGLENKLTMRAVHIHNVEPDDQVYTMPYLDPETQNETVSCPTAFCRSDSKKGYILWVGDLDLTAPVQTIIFTFMENYMDAFGRHPPKPKRKPQSDFRRVESSPFSSPTGAPDWAARKDRGDLQKLPVNQPCDNCGKMGTTRDCTKCRQVYYCSGSCQNKGLKKHDLLCSARKLGLAESIEKALKYGNPTPLLKILILGQDRSVVMERLVDAYRLRVEDHFKISGLKTGYYRNPTSTRVYMEDFIAFITELNKASQPARPEWWDKKSQIDCEVYAKSQHMRTFIGKPADDNEINDFYREPLMATALRALGDVICGRRVPEPLKTTTSEPEELRELHSDKKSDAITLDDLQISGDSDSDHDGGISLVGTYAQNRKLALSSRPNALWTMLSPSANSQKPS